MMLEQYAANLYTEPFPYSSVLSIQLKMSGPGPLKLLPNVPGYNIKIKLQPLVETTLLGIPTEYRHLEHPQPSSCSIWVPDSILQNAFSKWICKIDSKLPIHKGDINYYSGPHVLVCLLLLPTRCCHHECLHSSGPCLSNSGYM